MGRVPERRRVMTAARVLVTGAGGFVGRHLVEALLHRGCAVTAVDQQFDSTLVQVWQTASGQQLVYTEADAGTLPDQAVDYVIHAAAITAAPDELAQTPEANLRANLDPALAALEWAQRNGARRVVLLSSSAVFRETTPGPVDETAPTSPRGLYAVAKQTLESLVETLREEYGRDVVAVRLSNIYGTGELWRPSRPRVSLVARLVRQAVETGGITVYRSSEGRDWTFAPDVGEAIYHLLLPPRLNHALYNVASGQVLTPLDIAAAIQAVLPDVRIELREGDEPGIPPLTRRGYLSSQRLHAETGFAGWTPLAAGIRQVVDWQCKLEMTA
ncbi:MAG: NAD(P)-dependent oxidoreductase [Chloroflexi bacterium]|nr:NAD(P)-dependent oxidoreductase [Chloroflexota bacterium]